MKTSNKKIKPYEVLLAGNPILRKQAESIKDPKASEIKLIVDRMHATIKVLGGGVGLAAPQVGESIRLFIFNIPEHNKKNAPVIPWTTVINPKIEWYGEEAIEEWEACFCFPEIAIKVPRFERIIYSYQDLEGQFHQVEATGYHARAIQHEIDHLDGTLIIDRLKDSKNFGYIDALF